ncbi:MAG: flavin reductase [Oscillospiraceae bacterium]|nr:flavin reductase [Oscillospiraceae bacterium]
MKNFMEKAFRLYNNEWALVTAGPVDNFNTMTISWGGLGTLWNRPVATVYVKPIRYTHGFMDANDYFTVSFYDEQHKEALAYLGSHSGKDEDKVATAGFTPVTVGESTTFAQAKITLLCKKVYRQDMTVETMPQFAIDRYYTDEEPHTIFIGEVVDIIEG